VSQLAPLPPQASLSPTTSSLPASQPRRTKPLALINLGLPRTGTKSLRNALQIFGFENVYHYETILSNEHPEHCKAWNEASRLKHSLPTGTLQLDWTADEWDSKLLSKLTMSQPQPVHFVRPRAFTSLP
jgi:hypothetical protein